MKVLLAGLTEREFDVIKIILDKGALAVVVALAGFAFALLLERRKSYLIRQNEVSKIASLQVAAMSNACDELYRVGCVEISNISDRFFLFEQWMISLTNAPANFERDILTNYPPSEEVQSIEVQLPTGMTTLREHFTSLARSQVVVDAVTSEDFWRCDAVIGVEGSFVRQYIMAKLGPHDSRVSWPIFQSLSKVFSERGLSHSLVYHQAANQFRLQMLHNLHCDTRKQRKAFDGMLTLLQINLAAFDEFPQADILAQNKFLSREGIVQSLAGQITQTHAALLNQVGIFLRGHA